MNKNYPLGTPLTFVWRFQNPDGSPIVFVPDRFHFALRYTTGRGEKVIETFAITPDGDGITWTLPAKDQLVLGTFDLVLDIYVDGKLLEHYYYRKAFTLYQSAKGTINSSQYQEGATINLLSVGEFYHFMTGEVINTPDEEDITSDSHNLLKFKDRYADDGDGMGYVILRKNKTFAEQVTEENTIYEVRYDFDLNNGSVTMPSGCVLKFNGGSLSNGTLNGADTIIVASTNQIFSTDITLSGTWGVDKAYPEWFGAKGDGTTDDTDAASKALSFGAETVFTKTYLITSTITASGSVSGGGTLLMKCGGASYGFDYDGASNVKISNLVFDADDTATIIIRMNDVNDVVISGCVFKNILNGVGGANSWTSAVYFKGASHNITIERCGFSNMYNNPGAASFINITNDCKDIVVSHCTFDGVYGDNEADDADCIKIIGADDLTTKLCIENSIFSHFGKRGIKAQARGVTSRNNHFIIDGTSTSQAIDFQRGYGVSIADKITLNFDGGSHFAFTLQGDNNYVSGTRIYAESAPKSTSSGVFVITNGTMLGSTSSSNDIIEDVYAEGLVYFIRVKDDTNIKYMSVRDCRHKRLADETSIYMSVFMGSNASIDSSFIELSSSVERIVADANYVTNTTIVSLAPSTHTAYYCRVDNGNVFKVRNTTADVKVPYCEIVGNHAKFYASDDTNPSGRTTSAYTPYMRTKVGDVIIKDTPTASGSGVSIGYVCTADGTDSAVGTFVELIIPTS